MGGSSDDESYPLHGTSATAKGSSLRMVVVETVIFIVWVLLLIVNVLLHVLQLVYRLLTACVGLVRPTEKPRHVVIVGASFGGLAAQRELVGRRDVKVTLIDFKRYFEYTPGVRCCPVVGPRHLSQGQPRLCSPLRPWRAQILRCFVKPSFLSELTCPLPSSRNELLVGSMTGATAEAVVVRSELGEQQVPFDYLVLAVGSTYADPIKPRESEPTLAERKNSWADAAGKLSEAHSVIIIGAGAVGVELAGEILTFYPGKKVTFVDMANTILPGFDEAASSYSLEWLNRRGAELMLGEAIERIGAESVLLKSGRELEADVVYKCVGVMPNTAMLKDSPYAERFGFRNSIEVNDHLQVTGHPHVFCVGDMMSHTSKELKLGHTAEVNAHLAAHNILASVHGKPLLTYPHGVTGADTTPKIYCLSLGRYDAVMGFNGLVLRGWFVAVMKWLLEWTKVAAAAERPVGVLFWAVADGMSMWLGRTLLRQPTDDDLERDVANAKFDSKYSFPHRSLNFLKNPIWGELGMLLLRIVTALLIVHHGLDKLENTKAFTEFVIVPYFPFLPGPPVFWTYLAAFFEIAGSLCITIGIVARPAALLLAGTMVNAIAFQLMKFGPQSFPLNPPKGGAYTFEPSLAFLAVTLCIALVGPGRFAVKPNFPNLDVLKKLEWHWAELSMLLLRIVTASLIVHHGLDKLENTKAFTEFVIVPYFPFLPGPPVFWTYLAAFFEIAGSLCITIGIVARPAALLLAGTMVNAIAFQLMKFGPQSFPLNPPKGGAYTFEPSLAFFGVTVYLALAGPGRFAVRPNGF